MNILKKAEIFVTGIYNEKLNSKFTFHNLAHIRRVVKSVNLIAENSGVNKSDLEILNLAAWFHDIGHLESYEVHEEIGAKIAEKFLTENSYPENKIELVKQCIKVTNLSVNPKNLREKIIRDADICHLGKKSFLKRNKELRIEWKGILGKEYSDEEWAQSDIKFFNSQEFFTDFAKSQFSEQRKVNLEAIKNRLDNSMNEENKLSIQSDKEMDKMAKKYLKAKTPDRGIETMFRLTSKNHFTLSSIADSKAGTLISISAVIISIIISVLIRKLDTNPALIIPTILLLLTLMGTIIFAVLSTRPNITSFGLTKADVSKKKGNLLFFGNFISMPVEDYEWGIKELMNDREYLYNNLIRDIYYLGVVLGKKYRHLRIAYNIFMYGLIISVVTYIVAFAF